MNFEWLLSPAKVWSKAEVIVKPCPVPVRPGVYGWYFKELPPGVILDGCNKYQDLTLLYVGISPQKPSQSGKWSAQNLRKRIRKHFCGRADRSTLRKSLGCLLGDRLGLRLQVTDSGRLTFGAGEDALSEWMAKNAFVTWLEHDQPWTLEDELIASGIFPLNLAGNSLHPFHPSLSAIRKRMKEDAVQG